MKRNRYISMLCAGAMLLLGSCTHDEIVEVEEYPDGLYPLEISAADIQVEEAETRISQSGDGLSNSWQWDGTEKIAVMIDDGSNKIALYTLKTVNGQKVITSDAPLYWKDNNTDNVIAWYPPVRAPEWSTDRVWLGNQSENLGYALRGTGSGSATSPVSLTFTHLLAKVRIKVKNEEVKNLTKVQLYSEYSCLIDDAGKLSLIDGGKGDYQAITLKKMTYSDKAYTYYEANVYPKKVEKARINDADYPISNPFTPAAGKRYTIPMAIKRAPEVGDVYCQSGNYYKPDQVPKNETKIGVVFEVNKSKNEFGVVAMKNAANETITWDDANNGASNYTPQPTDGKVFSKWQLPSRSALWAIRNNIEKIASQTGLPKPQAGTSSPSTHFWSRDKWANTVAYDLDLAAPDNVEQKHEIWDKLNARYVLYSKIYN